MFKFFKRNKVTDDTQVGMPVYTGTVDEEIPKVKDLLKIKEDIINRRATVRKFATRAEVIEAIKKSAQKGDTCTIIQNAQLDDELKEELDKEKYYVSDSSDGTSTFISWR